ncbi:molybdopterin-binding protein [Brevibacillus ginsengisoli]|uniref:molybdopterin-binding protein n=1 Tax=Brevibacillus ginsengisoli TaxID=363854 RepID=UPI003CFB7161
MVKPRFREIPVQEAVGLVLPHDMTQIIPGKFKGRLFKKGHVITEADIEPLLSIGKEHIYILDMPEGYLHENEAAERIARSIVGEGLTLSEPHEGKVSLKAQYKGLVKINAEAVHACNELESISIATILTNLVVEENKAVAVARITPLIIETKRVEQLETMVAAYGQPIVELLPFPAKRVGMITTGSEVFKGRIEDKFGPVIRSKVEALGSAVVEQRFTPDDKDVIKQEIERFLNQSVDLVIVTGGMSVDPDDRTPGAISEVATEVVRYGIPMLPGSMMMIAYAGKTPILGLPGAVMYEPYTSFDVFLPRVLIGERITESDITRLGYGGLNHC